MALEVGTTVAMAAFYAGASTATVTALTVNAAVIGSAILTAASIGYSAYAARQQRNAFTSVNDDQGLQQTIRQAIPSQRLALGYAISSGALFWSFGDDTTRPYVYLGYLLANHECEALDSIYLNNERVFFDIDGNAVSAPFHDGATSFLQASFRTGSINQAIDPIIATDFTDMPTTFRQRGHCTLVIKAHYGTGSNRNAQDDKHKQLYGTGDLNPVIRFKGAKIYDPRDPAQTLADASTYAWSNNASLCLMHYLRWKWPHIAERIGWDEVAIAADIDDQWGFTKSGTAYRKGTIDGVVRAHETAIDVVQSLLTANSGKLIIDEGKFYPVPAQRKTAIATFHEGMLKGGISYSAAKPFGELINTVKVEFMAQDRDNKMIVGPVIQSPADVTADGIKRERTVRLPFTEIHQRAQMIANRVYNEGRLGKSLTLGSTIECLPWKPGQVIEVWLSNYPWINGRYEIISKTWDEQMAGYSLELFEYDEDVHDYDPATDEQDFVLDTDTLEAA